MAPCFPGTLGESWRLECWGGMHGRAGLAVLGCTPVQEAAW